MKSQFEPLQIWSFKRKHRKLTKIKNNMNTTILNQTGSRLWRFAVVTLAVGSLLTLTACHTSKQARSVSESGFLSDYSQLKKGKDDQAKLVYFAPGVDWKKYTKMYIEPVQLWKSEDPESKLGKLSKENQDMLTSFLYTELNNELQKSYTLVDKPGPDTIVLRSAITEAKKSAPVRNLLTTIVPFGIAANILVTAAFGTGIGVGEVQVEAELLDGQTNQRLAAAVDKRAGTKALRTKFDGTWGDVKLSFEYWAQKLETRLVELRAGKTVPDAEM
jgi:hypothetical protein